MPSDVEIAQSVTPKPLSAIATRLGLTADEVHPYGHDKGKVDATVLAGGANRRRPGKPKLVLVSAITPTRAGEGKTTTTIGLGQALDQLGESVCIALREPSLGPCMGVKGGATGGGYSQVIPMESINLHFTGDLHAITTAHNLLAAALDNRLHFQTTSDGPRIDPRRVSWRRAIDMNDRSLRNCMIGLGGSTQGVPRETGFDITASSEVMAMLCLATDLEDLRERIDRTIVAFDESKNPVTAKDIGVTGAMIALLQEAMMPNLVQTLEGTPALVHGGPFANIAHGCNSVVATKTAMHLADWTITEAGFGFDLGAEKFLDIKCVTAGLSPDAIVIVATIRALKLHGGVKYADLGTPDPDAVERGLTNLGKHVESALCYGRRPIVALNRFSSDSDDEIGVVRTFCERQEVPLAEANHFSDGGRGAIALAELVREHASAQQEPFQPLYDHAAPVTDKIETIATKIYGAEGVDYTKEARRALKAVDRLGLQELPICIAKTQASLSDDPQKLGRPEGFRITVRDLVPSAGAGFVVALTGDILRMPGLPRRPSAENIDVRDGKIVGLS